MQFFSTTVDWINFTNYWKRHYNLITFFSHIFFRDIICEKSIEKRHKMLEMALQMVSLSLVKNVVWDIIV